ncbi:hypothetical protein PC117_g14976 [Phytophthora cactorum]|uniref:Reverse transcriptase Ty1/copia-type domain-containing protein n=1 Tax=Phytophthora cactorum TaxID=29920 RepID=A0A8T1CQ67_9STRA|nr:hypothetical protein PC117_g14976 [Phytophthora cactorum]
MHRTILNLARCMVFGAGLPLSFWGDAGEYGMYVLNWSSSRANEDQKSSLKVLTGQASNLRHIVVFGSKVQGVPSENKVIVTGHAQKICALEEKPDEKTPTVQTPTTSAPPAARPAPRRSRRPRRKSRHCAEADGDVEVSNSHADDPEPKNYRQAQKCAESALWAAAEQEELAALQANNTWKLVKCDAGIVRFHIKFVYKKQRTGTG